MTITYDEFAARVLSSNTEDRDDIAAELLTIGNRRALGRTRGSVIERGRE